MNIHLFLILWVQHTLADSACKEATVDFSRDNVAVVFDYAALPENAAFTAVKTVNDMLPIIEKIHTRFNKVMLHMDASPASFANNVNLIPSAVATYNNKHNSEPMQVWLRESISWVVLNELDIDYRLGLLHGISQKANDIFPGTVSVILLDYLWMNSVNGPYIARHVELAKSLFQNYSDTFQYQIAVGLPINTHTTVHNRPEIWFPGIRDLLENADAAIFTMLPNANYIEEAKAGSHVDYFIEKFSDVKETVQKSLNISVMFKTSWPDTSEIGFTSYSNLVDFWKGIGDWAQRDDATVIFERVFDVPYQTNPQFQTVGWWRVATNVSYRNSSEYIYLDKSILNNCDVGLKTTFNSNALMRPRATVNFSKKHFIVALDPVDEKGERFDPPQISMPTINKELDVVSRRFGRIFLEISARYGYADQHAESMMDALRNLADFLASNRTTHMNPSVEVMLGFSGETVNDCKVAQEAAEALAVEVNSIVPNLVTTLVLVGEYEDQQDFEILNKSASENNLTLEYAWRLPLDTCFYDLGPGNKIYDLPILTNVHTIFLESLVTVQMSKLGFKRTGEFRTSLFDICKERVRAVAPDLDVGFFTSWPRVAWESENYAQVVNFWEDINRWAIHTNTTIVMDTAFNKPEVAGWWVIHKNESNTTDGPPKFYIFEKKIVARDLLGIKQFEEQAQEKGKLNHASLQVKEITGIVVGILILIGIVAGIFLGYRRWTRKEDIFSADEFDYFFTGSANQEDNIESSAYKKELWEIPEHFFEMESERVLGSGEFGVVSHGSVMSPVEEQAGENMYKRDWLPVAVKICRYGCISALKGLLSEIKILAYIGKHENVVSLIGAHTEQLSQGKLYVFVELCENGSLQKYLRSIRTRVQEMKSFQLISPDLRRWSREIANGMEYLARKRIVHADLATRNVLLTSEKIAKISDFGLSRRLYNYSQYVKKQQEPLPWRWMAPESLKFLEFNEKTDVWAFGVTLWEIYSVGDVPYAGLSWEINFAGRLEEGLVLDTPKYSKEDEYSLMQKCWAINPARRLTFAQICQEMGLQLYVNKL